jgi:hypothetical protein
MIRSSQRNTGNGLRSKYKAIEIGLEVCISMKRCNLGDSLLSSITMTRDWVEEGSPFTAMTRPSEAHLTVDNVLL